jgi:uncharacterized protein with PIN domain
MSVVLDASMTIAWLFADEHTEAAHKVMRRVAAEGAAVPSLWRLEVANVLRNAVRRGRCDEAYVDRSLARLERLAIRTDDETDSHAWGTTRALGGDATHHLVRSFGMLVGEQPGDRHRRVEHDAHPRRPSSSSSRIETLPRECCLLSATISPAAASASLRAWARAAGRRMTISPSCASISTGSPSLRLKARATSEGTRIARFLPHFPTMTCDMAKSPDGDILAYPTRRGQGRSRHGGAGLGE